jgi:ribose 5-phosphate isomerase B
LKSLFKKVCISSDHAGYNVKEKIKSYLVKNEISITDLGPFNNNKSVDYPDYAKKIAKRVKNKVSDVGILVCGSGTGMAMAANKYKGIRAAVCYNTRSTYLSRLHNNSNILCIGARLTKKDKIKKIVSYFLNTRFEGGRHKKRVKKI